MGFFSSKKVTYSGVGSAVQNLVNGPIENLLTTTIVSNQLNNGSLNKTFEENLSTGMGLKLRSFIDYAYRNGYTNGLSWRSSGITGEVFSNSTAYTNYLGEYVYPSSSVQITTPQELIKEVKISEYDYYLGDKHVVVKRFTRTKKHITTTTTDNYSFEVNNYYQGSNTVAFAMNKILEDPTYANISQYVQETAQVYSGNIGFLYQDGRARRILTSNKVFLFVIPSDKSATVTVSGTLYAIPSPVAEDTTLESMYTISGDGSDVQTDKSISGGSIFRRETDSLISHNGNWISNPESTLGFNSAKLNIVNLDLMIDIDSKDTSGLSGEEHRPWYSAYGIWYKGRAVVFSIPEVTSDKYLVANVTVHRIKEQTTVTTITEYAETEKYIDGVLVSSSEVEGASTSDSSSEVLLDTTTTHTDNYAYGSGNSYYDAIINTTTSISEHFCPIMPIKTWGKLSSSSWGNLYNLERKLYRKITGQPLSKWDTFVKSFADAGDDAKMIYYWLAVPINVDTEYTNEYFFHFFKWLAMNFNGTFVAGSTLHIEFNADIGTDFQMAYTFRVSYKIIHGTPPIPCKLHNYARYQVIGTAEPNDEGSTSWKGNFRDQRYQKLLSSVTGNVSYTLDRDNYPNLSQEEFDKLQASMTFTVTKAKYGPSSITFYYKISDDLYEKVYVTDFLQTHSIRNDEFISIHSFFGHFGNGNHGIKYYLKNSLQKNWKAVVDDDGTNDKNAGFSPIIIPIARGALESMGWYRQSGLLQVCYNVVISGWDQKTVKKKWYQSLMPIFIVITVVVVAVFTWGGGSAVAVGGIASSSATVGGAAVAAGVTATGITLNALVVYGLKAIALAVIAKSITYAANKLIGGTFGQIIGVVTAVAATVYMSYQFGLIGSVNTVNTTNNFWSTMNTWDGWLTLTKSVVTESNSALNTHLQNKADALQNQYSILQTEQSQKQQQMNAWAYEMASWRNDNITNIIVNNTYIPSSSTTSNSFLLGEDPDTFYTRVFDIDLYEMNASYVADFEDYLLSAELP